MKYKFLTLSLLLAGACATTVMAQDTNYYTPKWSDNIFVSVGGGIHAIENDGFNKLAPGMKVRVQDPAKLQSEAKKEEEELTPKQIYA